MTLLSIDQDKGSQLSLTENCLQADQERAERQRQYLAQLAEEAEYESSEATSLATSTMEGEHLINQEMEEREDESNSTTPQECLSADLTPTATPTHGDREVTQSVSANSSDLRGGEESDDVTVLKLQLKEVSYNFGL